MKYKHQAAPGRIVLDLSEIDAPGFVLVVVLCVWSGSIVFLSSTVNLNSKTSILFAEVTVSVYANLLFLDGLWEYFW